MKLPHNDIGRSIFVNPQSITSCGVEMGYIWDTLYISITSLYTQNVFKNVQDAGFFENGDLVLICRLNIYLAISTYPITLTQYELKN